MKQQVFFFNIDHEFKNINICQTVKKGMEVIFLCP